MPFGFIGSVLSFRRSASSSPPPITYNELDGDTPRFAWYAEESVLSGANVTSVPNHLGGGNDLTGEASHNPQYVASHASFNNRPVWDFPIGNQPRFTFAAPAFTGNVYSVYVVGRAVGAGTNKRSISIAARIEQYAPSAGAVAMHDISGASDLASTKTVANVPHIICGTLAAGPSHRVYVNSGTEDANVAAGSYAADTAGVIGMYAGDPTNDTFAWGGQIACVLGFNGADSAAKVAIRMSALGTKYGITIS